MIKLRNTLKAITLGLMLSVSFTTVAKAEPITIAIFGAAFASTVGGSLVSTLISGTIAWAAGNVINWLFPTPKDKTDNTPSEQNKLTVQYGERVSRGGIMGTVPSAGHLVAVNEYSNATHLQLVTVHADQPTSKLVKVKVNEALYDLTETSATDNATHCYTVDGLNGTIKIRHHNGQPGQLADTSLVANTTGWDSTRKYSAMSYIVSDILSDKSVYNGSPPNIVPIFEGGLWYDPRLDSSVGGSGSCRFGNSSTWVYTANPAVMAYHYLRGIYYNGVRVLGAGVPAAKLDFATFVAAMNVCDEDVVDPVGAHHLRYECHKLFDDTDTYGDILDTLCQAMGGYWAPREGKIAIFAGKAQSVVFTFTDDNLLVDEELSFDPKRAGESLYQTIMGTYTSPTDFSPAAYTAISPDAFLVTNVEPKVLSQDFPQIKNAHQAFLVAKQTLWANNLQGQASVAFDIKDIVLEVGDWVRWQSSIDAIGDRTYNLLGVKYDFKRMRMFLSFSETSADVFDDDSTAEDVVPPTRSIPISGYLQDVPDPAVDPTTIDGLDGSHIPALLFTYDPINDPAIQAVEIQYRPVTMDDSGLVKSIVDFTMVDGQAVSSDSVAAGTSYEARFRLNSISGRDNPWSSWIAASAPTADFTVTATVGDGTVTYPKLDTELQNANGILLTNFPGSIPGQIQALVDTVGELANAVVTNDQTTVKKIQTVIKQSTTARAAIISTQEAVVTESEARATAIEEVIASFGDALADGYLKLESIVDTMTSTATITAKVKAVHNDNESSAGWILKASVTDEGDESFFGVMGKFYVFLPGDTDTPIVALETLDDGTVKFTGTRMGRIDSLDGLSYIDFSDGIDIYSEST